MRFRPVEKITACRVIDLLDANFPEAKGTVVYLQVMSKIMTAFMNPNVDALERIYNAW